MQKKNYILENLTVITVNGFFLSASFSAKIHVALEILLSVHLTYPTLYLKALLRNQKQVHNVIFLLFNELYMSAN